MKTVCKNCGQTVRGNYCPNCGQSSDTGKIAWGYCLNELILNNFSFHRGVLYTAKSLIIKPKQTVREYLAGKRKRYTGALHFLVLVLLLRGLLNLIVGEQSASDVLAFTIKLGGMPIDFPQYDRILILVLTLVPSCVNYFLYKRLQYSLPEHFYINAYVIASSILLVIAFNLVTLFKWPEEWFNLFPLLVISFYVRIFYDKKQTLGGILKGMLGFLLGMILLIVVVVLVVIAAVFLMRLF
ncbi:MAG TPA: DUF3667 domain-containing protein [Candidatus Syntrophosphaera sp.]|nr:DUF3667 domain-containing protein [Candidatus Syntrophosphaera sp.]